MFRANIYEPLDRGMLILQQRNVAADLIRLKLNVIFLNKKN